ncbi:MAG TPA: zf-HC2 domain-containing protein [Gemmatimonas sp.]|uniref:zf-HC2 domain-containing protein n=1 Tax=Gemmatimonas sp. TaxID=1962908 RepID=UPI002ED9662C
MKTPEAIVIDCEAAMRRLWDYLDEELDAARLAEMEAHLSNCADCTSHVQFARAFLKAVRQAALGDGGSRDRIDDRESVATEAAPCVTSEGPHESTSSLKARVVAQLQREGFRSAR